ncbi:MAG TPA: hypothetical protein GXX51_05745 [Firmicutes bacterium]|nr:hypothetical protein [Bacillota bacterium]
MFTCEGTGLGMGYHDVMELEVPVKDRLYALLCEKLSEIEARYESFTSGGEP